jgi:hypothetical protein
MAITSAAGCTSKPAQILPATGPSPPDRRNAAAISGPKNSSDTTTRSAVAGTTQATVPPALRSAPAMLLSSPYVCSSPKSVS